MQKRVNTLPELRFPEFDGNWRSVQLGQLGELKNGLNKDKRDYGFGYPFVNLMDVFGQTSIGRNKYGLFNATQKDLSI